MFLPRHRLDSGTWGVMGIGMGYAIAAEAVAYGAEVTLVSGYATIEPPTGVDLVRVGSAEEMYRACADRFDHCDLFIAAAAVADYTPVTVAPQKIKKSEEEGGEEKKAMKFMPCPREIGYATTCAPGPQLLGRTK